MKKQGVSKILRESFYTVAGAPSLALLSDLHNASFERVLASLKSRRPALLFVAGDVVRGGRPENGVSPLTAQERVLPFLSACAALAPTFFGIGNHELYLDADDLRAIAATGVTVLDNRWTEYKGLVIGGLTSAFFTDYQAFRSGSPERYPRQDSYSGWLGAITAASHKPDTGWLEAYAAVPGYHILLCHHPEYYPLIPRSVPLILSGHAHGGQWRFFDHGVWSPGQGLWPNWTRGLYDGRLLVSAGLSNPTLTPRLFNPTEVCYVNG